MIRGLSEKREPVRRQISDIISLTMRSDLSCPGVDGERLEVLLTARGSVLEHGRLPDGLTLEQVLNDAKW